jgi:hypothetical protein
MNQFSEELWMQFRETLGLKESPLGVYYTNDKPKGVTPKKGIHLCMIGLLKKARKKGKTVYFDKKHGSSPKREKGFFLISPPSTGGDGGEGELLKE